MDIELIKLSENRGFKSKVFSDGEINSELNYYLWMCELQKWVRKHRDIPVLVNKGGKAIWTYEHNMERKVNDFKTYDKALEEGLKLSLKK